MFSAGWATVFNVLQLIDPIVDTDGMTQEQVEKTGGIPVWPIDDQDARKLGGATVMYLESIPANQKSRLKEFLEKHMPAIVLGGAFLEVAGPRAQYSFDQKRKAVKYRALLASQGPTRNNVRPIGKTHTEGAGAASENSHAPGYNATASGENSGVANAFADAS